MDKLIICLTFGCLNCDKPIPNKIACKGIQICSIKCLKELNQGKHYFSIKEVWKKDV